MKSYKFSNKIKKNTYLKKTKHLYQLTATKQIKENYRK